MCVGPSSGLIIAFVVAVWAAYFVPLVLRRYDEAGKNASVQEPGATGRIIAATRPEPDVAEAPAAPAEPIATAHVPLDRPAARLAARRRRRTLQTLLGLLAVTVVAAVTSFVPWLVVAAPVVLIVAWLVACRVQVRGELGLSVPKAPRVRVPRKSSSRKSAASSLPLAPDQEDTIVVSGQFEEVDPGRRHEMERVALTEDALDDQIVIAVPSVSTNGEALWDPLPVTLPTYVTKPRAGRTVRTIDFAQPGAWTSGHIEGEDVVLPQRAAQHGDTDAGGDERRAVGS